MSRQRITAKVRVNADYQAMTAELDRLGLHWHLQAPTGKGHPMLIIQKPMGGDPIRYPIACTPRGHSSIGAKVARMRKALRENGISP